MNVVLRGQNQDALRGALWEPATPPNVQGKKSACTAHSANALLHIQSTERTDAAACWRWPLPVHGLDNLWFPAIILPFFSSDVCHCQSDGTCHADVIIVGPGAYDREDGSATAPSSAELNKMARLREEPEADDGSTADGTAPARGAGWVGPGNEARPLRPVASPSRFPVEFRKHPGDSPLRRLEQISHRCACRWRFALYLSQRQPS